MRFIRKKIKIEIEFCNFENKDLYMIIFLKIWNMKFLILSKKFKKNKKLIKNWSKKYKI